MILRFVVAIADQIGKNARSAVLTPPAGPEDQVVPVRTSCRQRAVGQRGLEPWFGAAQRHFGPPDSEIAGYVQAAVFVMTAGG
jgi:hypothetical protein